MRARVPGCAFGRLPPSDLAHGSPSNRGPHTRGLRRAIAIIAARQPDNPFFLWLHIGADARVQQLVDAKCPAPPTSSPRMDWAWQRAEVQKRWERSLVWDCVFMNALLAK